MALSSVYVQLPLFPAGKVCCVCRTVKPYDEFYRDRRAGDGHTRDCKGCAKRRAREWRAARRDEINAAARAAYRANHDEEVAKRRAYEATNRERINAQHLAYYYANHERIRQQRCARDAHRFAHERAAKAERRDAAERAIRNRSEKMCSCCRALLPLTRFNRERKSLDGRTSRCKDCLAPKGRSWYETHRAEVIARARNWARARPDYLARLRRRACQRRRARMASAVGRHTDAEWQSLCAAHGHSCVCCGVVAPLTEDHIVPLSKGGSDWISNIQPLCRPCNSAKGTRTIRYI